MFLLRYFRFPKAMTNTSLLLMAEEACFCSRDKWVGCSSQGNDQTPPISSTPTTTALPWRAKMEASSLIRKKLRTGWTYVRILEVGPQAMKILWARWLKMADGLMRSMISLSRLFKSMGRIGTRCINLSVQGLVLKLDPMLRSTLISLLNCKRRARKVFPRKLLSISDW